VSWAVIALVAGGLLALVPGTARATASAGDLCLYGNDATLNTGEPMMAGTSPSLAALSAGTEVAYQTSGGALATYLDATRTQSVTGYGLDPATSPTIAASGSTVVVAFTANSSDALWTGNGSTESPTSQTVEAGTSPSVAVLNSGATEYAFNAPDSDLVTGDGSTWSDSSLGADPGSSPVISAVDGGGYEAGFQANTNALWEYSDNVSPPGTDTSQGMNGGGTPAVTGLGTAGDYELAFEANNNDLYIWGSEGNANTTETMAPGTNPAISAVGASAYDIAYQGANGDLWLYGSTGSIDTGQAMAANTSPAITTTAAGYEVAYQCAPPVPTTTATTTATTTVTVPVTSTTPTPAPPVTKRRIAPRIRARYSLKLTWNGASSYLYRVKLVGKLPKGSLITFRCTGDRRHRCPKLGKLPRTRRTFAKELAVVARRRFTPNNVLTIITAAKHHTTELISVRLPGDARPRYTTRWKS
jgi:hypothetical protein